MGCAEGAGAAAGEAFLAERLGIFFLFGLNGMNQDKNKIK
jgi:hypothetical protein